jgi:DNA-binding SARP family transcriptional activator
VPSPVARRPSHPHPTLPMSADSPQSPAHLCLHGTAQLVPMLGGAGAAVALERKQAWLLAYLWLEGPTPRGRLAGMLWPEAPEARARGNLRQRLAVLRQATGLGIVTDTRGVLALAPHLKVQPTGADTAPLLATFDYDDSPDAAAWLAYQRTRQLAQQGTALRAEVRAAVQAGHLDEALLRADALMALDRESEEAYRTQMEVLYLRGDSAAAIAVWDRCKDMLRQLYGVLPSVATRQLGETILHAATQAANQATSRDVPVDQQGLAADAIPASVLRPPQLVSRQPQVLQMLAAWRAGQHLCISGEAGLGKSRLLAEFAGAAGRCASAAARPGDAAVPYATLSRLLFAALEGFELSFTAGQARQAARLLPRLAARQPGAVPAPVQTDYERRQCLLAVQDLLTQAVAQGCKALLFDDLQFSDTASLEAVFEMADTGTTRSGEPAALPWVFGVRGDEFFAPGAALLQALVAAGRCTRLDLQPLDQAGVATLVGSLALPGVGAAALSRRLWRQVGGNPAFVLESVKLLLALGGATSEAADTDEALPLPPDVLAVIERRIALLSPAARHLAQLAAVAGDSYSVPLAAAALACTPLDLSVPLRELELRQVLYGRQFVHDVIATGVRRTVAQSVAEFMHRFVAEHLQQHGGEPARTAAHWLACGEHLRAGQAFNLAAAAAAAASRPVEQCALLDQAAACFDQAGANDEVFEVLWHRSGISAAPDRAATRGVHLQRMQALARNERQRLRVLLLRQSWETDHQFTEGVAVGLQAIQQALALGESAMALSFARNSAWRLAMAGKEAQALQTLEDQRAWTMSEGSPEDRADFHSAMAGVLGYCDRLAPAIAEGRLAVAELRKAGRVAGTLPTLANMGLMLYWRGELAAAKTVLLEAAELRDQMHGRGSSLIIDVNLGTVQRDLGEYIAAQQRLAALIEELARPANEGGDTRTDLVIAQNHLAQLWLSLGQPARAQSLLTADDADVALRLRARRVALRMRATRLLGNADATLLAQAQDLLPAHESAFHRGLLELEIACALPADAALQTSLALLQASAVLERPGLHLHVATRGVAAALALGDLAQAETLAALATPLLASAAPFDIERAEVWLTLAALHRAQGRPDAASALLQQGAQWLRHTAQHGVASADRHTFLHGPGPNARLLD